MTAAKRDGFHSSSTYRGQLRKWKKESVIKKISIWERAREASHEKLVFEQELKTI